MPKTERTRRTIHFNTDARNRLKSGVDQLANAVRVTIGAKGRNVVIQESHAAPHATKDGVTVARSISLTDPVENMGAEMVQEVAAKVVEEAGDGTTTATILAQAIVDFGFEMTNQDTLLKRLYRLIGKDTYINQVDVKRGIDAGVAAMVERLSEIAEPISH